MTNYNLAILFILLLMIIGCSQSTDSRFTAGTEIEDSLKDFRYIRDTFYDRVEIESIIQNVEKEELIGHWEDSLTLYYDQGKWRGWIPIDKTNKLNLSQTTKYIWKEEYRHSKLDTVKTGQYWTSNYNDSSFLQLIFNYQSDTIFNQGDTGFVESYLIDYFEADTMLIRAYHPSQKTTKDEAYLMIRKKTNGNTVYSK